MTYPSEDDFEGWYVIRTKQHAERRVADELTALGIESYLPMERYTLRRSRQVQTVERPLMLRYLFADIRLKGDFYRVKIAHGVDSFLATTGGRPRRVRERELDRLREMEAEGRFDRSIKPPSPKTLFSTGEVVKITDGPFAGFAGVIEKGGEERSFRVLAWLFGRETAVTIPAKALEAA